MKPNTECPIGSSVTFKRTIDASECCQGKIDQWLLIAPPGEEAVLIREAGTARHGRDFPVCTCCERECWVTRSVETITDTVCVNDSLSAFQAVSTELGYRVKVRDIIEVNF